MKKFTYILLALLFMFSLSSCTRKENSNITAREIIEKMKQAAHFDNPKEEMLTDTGVAERYGISVDSLAEGIVYSNSDDDNIDKIILAVAKDDDSVQKIESALASEKIRLNDAWENDEEKQEKLKNMILKSRGKYVVLIVSDDAKSLERIFDDLI